MLPLLLLVVAGEMLVQSYPNSYRYKNEWMESNAGGVKTLLLGASHMYAGINPALLGEGTFSLANVSQHYEQDYYLLNKFAPKLTSLKTVVLTIDDAMLFDPPLEQGDESYRCTYYNLYMGCDKYSHSPKYALELCNFAAWREKLNKAVPEMLSGNVKLDCDSLGFATTFPTPAEWDHVAMSLQVDVTLKRHESKDNSFVAHNAGYIEKIAVWCQEHDVQLVLVSTPLYSDYSKRMAPEVIATMNSIAIEMCTKHDAIYYNLMNEDCFTGTDFYDADHLSQQGAAKLTRMLRPLL